MFLSLPPHDAGTAVGSAIYAQMQYQDVDRYHLGLHRHTYWGSTYDEDIESSLKRSKIRYKKFDTYEKLIEKTIKELSSGKIIGWFQGRMEFGPRALGNRSILANPCEPDIKAKLNYVIKNREGFRPFAPSVLSEKMHEVFENVKDDPYMICVDYIREEYRKMVPAVTHIDGSGRPQSVCKEHNPLYHKLITAFYNKTNIPLLLNTSFNYNNEPIVRTPQDAIKCFFSTGIDSLAIGKFYIEKEITT